MNQIAANLQSRWYSLAECLARFNNSGANENIGFSVAEGEHSRCFHPSDRERSLVFLQAPFRKEAAISSIPSTRGTT